MLFVVLRDISWNVTAWARNTYDAILVYPKTRKFGQTL